MRKVATRDCNTVFCASKGAARTLPPGNFNTWEICELKSSYCFSAAFSAALAVPSLLADVLNDSRFAPNCLRAEVAEELKDVLETLSVSALKENVPRSLKREVARVDDVEVDVVDVEVADDAGTITIGPGTLAGTRVVIVVVAVVVVVVVAAVEMALAVPPPPPAELLPAPLPEALPAAMVMALTVDEILFARLPIAAELVVLPVEPPGLVPP